MGVPRRWREGRFLALIVACGIAVAGSVWSGLRPAAAPAATTGARPIDARALAEKLRDGSVVRHEALYWAPAAEE